MTVTPTQDAAQIALGNFLAQVLPSSVEIIAGNDNRVPSPRASSFVIMTPLRFARLRTNIDTPEDVRFTGSIAASPAVLTVTAVAFGTINEGASVFGTGVAANTKIVDQLSGTPGGVGTYSVSVGQTLASQTLSAGQNVLEQGAEVTFQLDFHTLDNTSADLAQTVATTMRDPYGVQVFADQNLGVVPLYADDPRQVPFINENQQYEWRWVLEASMQVNQAVRVPQQFADEAVVGIVDVDAAYPP